MMVMMAIQDKPPNYSRYYYYYYSQSQDKMGILQQGHNLCEQDQSQVVCD